MALGPKWGKNGQKWLKNRKTTPNLIFSLFLGHFSPFLRPIFSHFWISARFPFYARRPDSQVYTVMPIWSQMVGTPLVMYRSQKLPGRKKSTKSLRGESPG